MATRIAYPGDFQSTCGHLESQLTTTCPIPTARRCPFWRPGTLHVSQAPRLARRQHTWRSPTLSPGLFPNCPSWKGRGRFLAPSSSFPLLHHLMNSEAFIVKGAACGIEFFKRCQLRWIPTPPPPPTPLLWPCAQPGVNVALSSDTLYLRENEKLGVGGRERVSRSWSDIRLDCRLLFL